ncbi:MAG: DNA-3-methyladenine glycosylase, partial [SAR324 cluster bacterium]|nr:DNA-3-methyladenine glycosylase [SAR324 cluster bacterium]
MKVISDSFFERDPREVAPDLLGKVLRHRIDGCWLEARIIETEAYLLEERGSHASLGETPSRRALFMEAGTIYMYYARGGDSFNFSCLGPGNAVLIKAGIPHPPELEDSEMLDRMQRRNPINGKPRKSFKLCSGQTLFCKSLGLKVPDWNRKRLVPGTLELADSQNPPLEILNTTRLGIP